MRPTLKTKKTRTKMSESNGYSPRSSLLGFARKYKDATLPSGNLVRIQDFNNAEHEELQLRTMDSSGHMNVRGAYEGFAALLVVRALVDADGTRLFGDEETDLIQESMDPEDVAFLRDEIISHTQFGESGIESQKKS